MSEQHQTTNKDSELVIERCQKKFEENRRGNSAIVEGKDMLERLGFEIKNYEYRKFDKGVKHLISLSSNQISY
jgi:hypothetical protein